MTKWYKQSVIQFSERRKCAFATIIFKAEVPEFVITAADVVLYIFQQYYFFVLVRGGDVDKTMLWYWQPLWRGLYNIISALPD